MLCGEERIQDPFSGELTRARSSLLISEGVLRKTAAPCCPWMIWTTKLQSSSWPWRRSLRDVKFFLHFATGATETVDPTSISDLMDLLGSNPLAADTVAKVFLQALDAIAFMSEKITVFAEHGSTIKDGLPKAVVLKSQLQPRQHSTSWTS